MNKITLSKKVKLINNVLIGLVMFVIATFYFVSCCDGINQKNEEIDSLKVEIEELGDKVDILSDAIRNAYDCGETFSYNKAVELLQEAGYDTCLIDWSYCY